MAFQGAQKFNIQEFNGSKTSITNNVYAQTPIDILHGARALKATTSTPSTYTPSCTEGTRTGIIKDMISWAVTTDHGPKPASDEAVLTSILWLSGPAGAGKTAIMKDVAEECRRPGLLESWTYFFSTQVNVAGPFVATIAYQLITSFPELEPSILQVISRNRYIFLESLDVQMRVLVIEPLESISPPWSYGKLARYLLGCLVSLRVPRFTTPKIVITIDGFDECRNTMERRQLLQSLHFLVSKLPQSIRVIVASRPELDIRTTFENPEFQPLTHSLKLQDYDGRKDVRLFCRDEIEKIRTTHPLRGHLPSDWPPEDFLDMLEDKSSGFFILPATAMKFISELTKNPMERLEVLRKSFSSSIAGNPLEELDNLYSIILHPTEADHDIPLMKCLLHLIMFHRSRGWAVGSPSFFDEFLQLVPGTVETTLGPLHSILHVPSSYSPGYKSEAITFHHKSLEDYLLSPQRSIEMFQPPYKTHLDFTLFCTLHLQQWADNPGPITQISMKYAGFYWNYHLREYLAGVATSGDSIAIHSKILDFDPRISWRVVYVRDGWISEPSHHEVFHSLVCPAEACLLFCTRLRRMSSCRKEVNAFITSMEELKSTEQERLTALSRFDTETDLYEEDEVKQWFYPI